MSNILTLYKVLSKNVEMKLPKQGAKGAMYMSLGILAASCIMIPCCIIVGFISYIMTLALEAVSVPSRGLLAEIHIMSACSMVFGILVIFNILFFSSDREHLVPLPFKSHELLAGKFLFSYMAESVMEFMILLSMFIGYFIACFNGIVSVIAAIIGVVLIPLLPLVYCVIISLIVFGLIKGIHNTKLINHVSSIVLLLFVALFLISFKDMGAITVDNYITTLANDTNLFTNILNKIFFTVPFLLNAIDNNSIISLIIYIALNAAMVGVMLILGKFLYQPCLYAVGALGDTKKKNKEKITNIAEKSQFNAYISKELKVLLRTKAYSGNCFYINLIWPLGMALFLYLNRNKDGLQILKYNYNLGHGNALVVVGLVTLALPFIACAMNSVASTAFTREGAHLSLVKYIPVPYKTQLLAKEFISVLVTFPPLLLTLIIFGVYININPLWYIYYGILIFINIIITTVVGVMLDSASPHSTWDDEYSALRGNLNTFFDMAVMMVLALLIACICFILYNYTSIGIIAFHICLITIPLVLAILCVVVGQKRIINNMIEM